MRAALFTITLLLSMTAMAATVYRWVDEQGVVHYSDQPHPGAEKVHLQAAQGFQASSSSTSTEVAGAPGPVAGGLTCEIDSPTNEQMFMNAHSVSGHVRMSSDPGPNAQLNVLVDGMPVSADSSGAFTVDPIDRGQHTVSATVTAAGGQTLCQAPAVTFYVHQPSKLAPNPVNRPAF